MKKACVAATKTSRLMVEPVNDHQIKIAGVVCDIFEKLPEDTPDNVVSAMIIFKFFYFSNKKFI